MNASIEILNAVQASEAIFKNIESDPVKNTKAQAVASQVGNMDLTHLGALLLTEVYGVNVDPQDRRAYLEVDGITQKHFGFLIYDDEEDRAPIPVLGLLGSNVKTRYL